ncbi:hypothetical protein [Streptosporangium sp. NPDC048865]
MTFAMRLKRFTVRAVERVPDATAAAGVTDARRLPGRLLGARLADLR